MGVELQAPVTVSHSRSRGCRRPLFPCLSVPSLFPSLFPSSMRTTRAWNRERGCESRTRADARPVLPTKGAERRTSYRDRVIKNKYTRFSPDERMRYLLAHSIKASSVVVIVDMLARCSSPPPQHKAALACIDRLAAATHASASYKLPRVHCTWSSRILIH